MQANWCKGFCPKMAAFNKIFEKQDGKGLIKTVVLTGTDEQIKYCIEQEKIFFDGINKDISTPGDINPDAAVLFERNSDKEHNTFDVSRCKIPNKYLSVIKATGLNFNEHDLDNLLKDKDLSGYSDNEIINNTLLLHYEKTDDNNLRKTDFDWAHEKVSDEQKQKTESSEYREWHGSENGRLENARSKKLETPTFNNKPKEDFRVKEEKQEKDPVTEIHKPEEKKEPERVVIPEPEKKPEEVIQKKKSLSKEEYQHNLELLKKIQAMYKEVHQYILDECDSRWRLIGNKIADTIKDKTYGKTQWCLLYLEQSDDYSTHLYELLYKLDEASQNFVKEVVHQVEHMGCPICNKEWDEDVTFLVTGIHHIQCPGCDAEIAYEKEEPTE